jgi:Ser/Thr protein kinase RdoA (MazF antagonist)
MHVSEETQAPLDHAQIARDHFGVSGTATALPGYADSNTRIDTADGTRYVLRVSLEDPNIGRLRFVNEAMEAARTATFDTPSSVPTSSGHLLADLTGDRVARLLTWVDGVTADDAGRPEAAAMSVGRTAAEMLHVLEPLQPNYDRSFFLWDPGYSLPTIEDYRNHVKDKGQRSLVEHALSELRSVPFDDLPLQVIHSDLNAGNIILSGDEVTGVIDFEDVAMTIRIGELSVACAYAMLVQDDPIAVAMDVIAGYRETASVTELEATHLYALTLSRMGVSVSIAASQPPGNPHQHHISGIMWDLLERLLSEDTAALAAQFKDAALS